MTFELEPISLADILRGLAVALAGVIAWIYLSDRNRSRDDYRDHGTRISALELQMATRKDMDESFKRVHERIDSMQGTMNEQHRELLLLLVNRSKERE